MTKFTLSNTVDKDKVFLVNLSEIEGVFSPLFFQTKPKKLAHNIKLKNISSVNPSRNKPKFKDDDLVPYVGLPETDEHTREIVNVVLRPYKEVKGRSVILPNDILFARIEPSIFNQKYIFAGDLKGYNFAFTSTEFYIIEQKSVNIKYIFTLLFTDYVFNQVKGKTTGSTGRRRLDLSAFNNIEIPKIENTDKIITLYETARQSKQKKEAEAKKLLVSIDEYLLGELGITLPEKDNSLQNRIFTSSLSKVSGGRFDPKLYDNNTQALRTAISKSSSKTSKLKDFIIQSFAGDWGKDENEKSGDNYTKCLVIRATEFDNQYNLNLVNSRVKYRYIHNDKLTKIDIQTNDLLIEKSGGSPDQPVGRIAILRKDNLENNSLCYSNFIHKIRVSNKINPEYLFCFLKTVHNIKLTDAMQSQTNGIRNLIMSNYINQDIPIPPIEKQNKIAEYITKIRNKAKQLQKEAVAELEKAKQEVENMILKTE